ncbi:MAG TPA: NHL repeat-containing protein, partial [Solirubrobacteraceae bacterium]|nr:NHL repeat-containing protein [Solirubrobacteraceae bacterium]
MRMNLVSSPRRLRKGTKNMIMTRCRSNLASLAVLITLMVAVSAIVGVGGAYAAGAQGFSSAGAAFGGLAGADTGGLALPFVRLLDSPGSALLSRAHQGVFGSFGGESPQSLAVDQVSGDVYVLDTQGNQLLRFSAGGAPVDFTAGPGAGTNAIPSIGVQGFPGFDQVAVDGSNGPAKGDIYVTNSGSRQVRVFAASGESLGTLTGTKTPSGSLGEDCGVAVDQSNGDLYVADWNNRIWRYSPSGSTVSEADYSGGIATTIKPCSLAVANGHLYAKDWQESPTVGFGAVEEYQASAFVSEPSSPATAAQVATGAIAVSTDPANGDLYVDEGNKITVLNSSDTALYSFGTGEIGTSSAGVAVAAGGDSYVSDSTNHQIHIYGPTLEAGSRANLGSFGSFGGESPQS